MTMVEEQVPTREEVSAEDTWDISSLYADQAAWEADVERISNDLLPALTSLQGSLANGPEALLAVFQAQEALGMVLEQIYVYASLRADEDTANQHHQALEERATALSIKASAATSWIEPELLALSDEQILGYISALPALEVYRRALEEQIRLREHTRSGEVEELLAQSGEISRGAQTTFNMFSDADLKFPPIEDDQGKPVEVTMGRYSVLLENPDQRIRRDTFMSIHSTYRQFRNMLAANYATNVRSNIFYAKARGYDSALDASLKPKEIPMSVYDNLISTVHEHLPKLHRYGSVRKRILGIDSLHAYDWFVPLNGAAPTKIDFEQGASLILSALEPLGAEYSSSLGHGLESRWVDRYENKNKRSGAYSWGCYTSQPFILMNYKNNLNSLFTLAHELGHSMHSLLTRKNQPYTYGSYTLFVAEVASTLNEALLAEYMLKTSDDPALRLQLVTQQIDDIRGTLLRQTLFAEFERETHRMAEQGEALTADTLSALYRRLIEQYYGPELVFDEELDIEWARIPHFYRSFYVYQYSTGISAALALADKILTEGPGAAENYVNFLRGGNSKSSIDLLKGAGVDMTTPDPIHRAMNRFGDLVTKLDELTA
ncbi:oligoendopeptidase F [Herpetosiphon llansteffanensis]|uniref:oligoendopeptidase F n=1 Tax=Herpetosiphon llansteffanensis TaxID=2094568 RepID=UPI000D7C177D|nr:oligoendopeptidase F [Herpetosiphon llansteffanensis]